LGKNIWNFYGGIYYEYNKTFVYESPAGHRITDQRMTAWTAGLGGMGVVRHADAGYDLAIRKAKEKGIQIPSLD
jgi:urocanate hydratase